MIHIASAHISGGSNVYFNLDDGSERGNNFNPDSLFEDEVKSTVRNMGSIRIKKVNRLKSKKRR